jgi:hypothetical protein
MSLYVSNGVKDRHRPLRELEVAAVRVENQAQFAGSQTNTNAGMAWKTPESVS